MARKATASDVSQVLSWLRQEVRKSLRRRVGNLIDALRARTLCEARELTYGLSRDLEGLGSIRSHVILQEIAAILNEERAFENCDEISVLLLSLEQELDRRDSSDVHSPLDLLANIPIRSRTRLSLREEASCSGKLNVLTRKTT